MWPWEHAALAYLGYSVYCRLRGRRPEAGAVVALVVGSQLPDLIDKPLAWGVGVLPAGRSLAHSYIVAVPVCLAVWLVARRFDKGEVGTAFAVGYLLHPPADTIPALLYGNGLYLDFLVWPLRPITGPPGPTFDLDALLAFLSSPLGIAYLSAELFLLGVAFLLWRDDGYPGLAGWDEVRRTHRGETGDPEPSSDIGE